MKPRHFTTYQLLSLLVLCLSAISSFAQAPPANNATAKVSGRITIEGQPVLGVQVLFIKDDGQNVISGLKPASAKTNADGTYEIENLSAGSYHVAVYAPSYLIEGEMPYGYGKAVNIGKGDQIDDLDFSLRRGGVITGKVTDEYGKPVIAEGVGAFRLDQQGKRDNTAATQMLRWQTDDRGVYRIFGLQPGDYLISATPNAADLQYAMQAGVDIDLVEGMHIGPARAEPLRDSGDPEVALASASGHPVVDQPPQVHQGRECEDRESRGVRKRVPQDLHPFGHDFICVV